MLIHKRRKVAGVKRIKGEAKGETRVIGQERNGASYCEEIGDRAKAQILAIPTLATMLPAGWQCGSDRLGVFKGLRRVVMIMDM